MLFFNESNEFNEPNEPFSGPPRNDFRKNNSLEPRLAKFLLSLRDMKDNPISPEEWEDIEQAADPCHEEEDDSLPEDNITNDQEHRSFSQEKEAEYFGIEYGDDYELLTMKDMEYIFFSSLYFFPPL